MKQLIALGVTALMLAAACASSSPKPKNVPLSAYLPGGEPMAVGVIPAAVLHDAQRSKDLQIGVDYPAHGGPYPVIIFSHEYGAPENAYVGLTSFWASHGYVVIRPRHADFGALHEDQKDPFASFETPIPVSIFGKRKYEREQKAKPFQPDPAELWASQTKADWANRAADIRLVIDSIPQLVRDYPELEGRIDASKIGVGGHSYGAFTAMLVGGLRTFYGGTPASYVDPRVKAIEAAAPQGSSAEGGLTADSFATLRVPALFVTGSRDYGSSIAEDPAWRRQAFELSPAGDKWFVGIAGVGPGAYTGQRSSDSGPYGGYASNEHPASLSSPAQATTTPPPDVMRNVRQAGTANLVRRVSLAFWDAYLKNETSGREFLSALLKRPDVQVANK